MVVLKTMVEGCKELGSLSDERSPKVAQFLADKIRFKRKPMEMVYKS